MSNFENFDWGNTSEWYIDTIKKEFLGEKHVYSKVFDVEEDDVVLDLGASVGPFGFVNRDKKIKHLYCFEPSIEFICPLAKNTEGINRTIIPYGIGKETKFIHDNHNIYEFGKSFNFTPTVKFSDFIKKFKIEKIDFLKTDCEGGEYDVFNNDNVEWIFKNVRKITGEWHLNTVETKEKFRTFRDSYLKMFTNYKVYSVDGVNIKWDLWNEHFIEYYNEVIIHIDNRKNGDK